jgi:trans-2,3-dihydro-3-hydroxyanthranilate isomerase
MTLGARAKRAIYSGLPYTLLDVFTDVPLAGNAVAVVHDADGVDDETMLAFAQETRLSETCFVQSPTVEGADYRNRIWTVTREVPFAGHPSLGVAVAVARRREERETRFVQQTPAGLQQLHVTANGSQGHASVLTEPVVFGDEVDPGEVMAAVGLAGDDADPDRSPQFASVGLDTLIAPVARADALSRAVPDFDRVDALSEIEDFNLYLVALDRETGSGRARMFTRWIPGGEDPATGSAVAPLCAYLAERENWTHVEVIQGVEMGRPSRLVAELEDGRVRVGGDVVIVIEGEIVL